MNLLSKITDAKHTQLAQVVAKHGPSKPKECPRLQRVANGRFVEVG